jgi:hypothetical protein
MNCKLLKISGILILLIFFKSYSFAQDNDDALTDTAINFSEEDSINDEYENIGDTIVIKTIFDDDNDSILKWKHSRDFTYMAYLDSLLRKKKGLKKDTINIENSSVTKKPPSQSSDDADSSFGFLNSFPVRIFLWLMAIFFIGFILYKLFFKGGLFSKKEKRTAEEIEDKEPESLNDYSAYNTFIHEAEIKNDFNLALRYLYLQSLKKLSENELINFSPDKTNNLYVRELSGRSYQQEFSYLTLNYEYVWYGGFTIDKPQYQKIKEQFILFNKKV